MQKIPVYIITGFLGAGKTTLLNKILRDNPKKQFAIIENEFGEVNIDSGLVIGVSGDIYELQNGCVCCTRSSELADTLIALADSARKYDYAIIETTGVADPNGVAAVLYTRHVKEHYKYSGCICVAGDIDYEVKKIEIAGRQFSFADMAVTRGNPEESRVHSLLKTLNPDAELVAFNNFNFLKFSPSNLTEISIQTPLVADSFESFALRFDVPFDRDYFIYATELCLAKFKGLFRVKGLINFEFENSTSVFQSVGTKIELTFADKNKAESVLVFIGIDLDREYIARQLREALAEAG